MNRVRVGVHSAFYEEPISIIDPLGEDAVQARKANRGNLTFCHSVRIDNTQQLLRCLPANTLVFSDPEEICKLRVTLTKVEDALKALKVDLGMRPTYHQLARRTAAQLFISVLACHLLSAVELTVRQDNDKKRWSTIKEQLTSHYRATIVITSDKGVVYYTRAHRVGDPVRKETYHLLGVSDPLGRIMTAATHL